MSFRHQTVGAANKTLLPVIFMLPIDYCINKIAPRGSSFYYSLLFTDPKIREQIIILHAFEEHINAIRFECSDTQVAKQKLQWWRSDVAKLKAGESLHPVNQAISSSINLENFPPEIFYNFIDHAEVELLPPLFENFDQWLHYHYQTPSMIKNITMKLLSQDELGTTTFAHEIDIIIRLTKQIIDLAKFCRAGIISFSQEDLEKFEVKDQDLVDGKMSANVHQLLKEYTAQTQDRFKKMLHSTSPELRQKNLNYILFAELHLRLLSKIEKHGFKLFETSLQLNPLHKLWIALKTKQKLG